MGAAALYQVACLGRQADARRDRIISLIQKGVEDLGLAPNVIEFVLEIDKTLLNPKVPRVAMFFGYQGAVDAGHPSLAKILDDSVLIIPIVSALDKVSDELPPALHHINAIDAALLPETNLQRIASLILEGFRLLRKERRLFISYRRTEAQPSANQLYDALDAHGFDVFIDTRSVPPGADFQAELWHRLSDSDVVVLIDTPGFRTSRWTKEELARANATNIQILHLLWPGQPMDAVSAFSWFYQLRRHDFASFYRKGRLKKGAVKNICDLTEMLRSRAIAARYRYLVDSFCDAARDHGLIANVQPDRWISVEFPDGAKLAAVPTIGVPTSGRFHSVFDSIAASGAATKGTWLLFDGRGILTSWLSHLNWLGEYLPVKSVNTGRADEALKRALS